MCDWKKSGDLEADVCDENVTVLLKANNHRSAAGVVVTHLSAAEQRAPGSLARTALAADWQTDWYANRAAGFRTRGIQNRFIGRLLAATGVVLVLVGMLVPVFDAWIRRTARFCTTIGLAAARWLHGTGGFLSTASHWGSTGGIQGTTVAKTSISNRGYATNCKRERDYKAAKKT